MIWVVETCVLDETRTDEFRRAFAEQGVRAAFVLDADHAEDARSLPPIGASGVVAYGSKSVIPLATRREWSPGVWTGAEFDFEVVQRALGDAFLNADALPTVLEKVVTVARDRGLDRFFVRPANDDKSFAGMTSTIDAFPGWLKRMVDTGYLDGLDIPVMVASPKELPREWRFVVAGGEPIASSLYREGGARRLEARTPKRVDSFAREAAARYAPAPVFVMDVAETGDGVLSVVELNAFNSAELYACDISRVVAAVTATAH
jgi:hypothetical protein